MRGAHLPLAIAAAIVAAAPGRAHADDAHAEYRLGERGTPHAGVPFALDVLIEGFDESPQPEVPTLTLAGARATFLRAQPDVSRGIQIINGRRSDFVKVTWVLRWQVEAQRDGLLELPALTVRQGSKRASVPPAQADVKAVAVTDAMKLSLALPERPIFVGETVPVTLTWLFRAQLQDNPHWSIPLLTTDAFTASAPPTPQGAKTLSLPAAGKDLELPYQIDQAELGGGAASRLTTTFFLTPRKVGKLELPASSVAALLPVGRADFFGNAPSRMFRAVDVPRTLEVKPLPETDKPANFAGAVGEQFAIDVSASRSVVKLGEPVELAIRIKSGQRLDTLALGRIDGEGGLAKDKFSVPSEPATGELSADGKTKTFKVTVQVTGPATEIPAIAFAYFDPTRSTYQTIRSEPIALSVAGGAIVSTGDVVAAMLCLGVFGSGIAFALNFRIVEAAGATVSSTVTYVIPLFAVLAGMVFLGEGMSWHEPVGGAVVLQTRDGHDSPGTTLQVTAGRYGRASLEFQHGGSDDGGRHWYVAGNVFRENVTVHRALEAGLAGGLVVVDGFPKRPMYWDFDRVAYGTRVAHTFKLRNEEGRDVTILDVLPSCGCTQARVQFIHIKRLGHIIICAIAYPFYTILHSGPRC